MDAYFQRCRLQLLRQAIADGRACTVRCDTGVEISGVFQEVITDPDGAPIYLRTGGPTRLSCDGRELPGHGPDRHPDGFGAPVGALRDFSRCLSLHTSAELQARGLAIGQRARLEYESGITLDGLLGQVARQGGQNLVLSFTDCRVTHPDGRILFDPAWGDYDLAVGTAITWVGACAFR